MREARRHGAGAGGEEERDGIGPQPTDGERDGSGRLAIEPLEVVDEHEDRPLLGAGREQ
jgi:hypothetical protein